MTAADDRPMTARDQVPGLQAPPRPGADRDLPGLGRPHGARPLHRHHPRRPGLQGTGHARHRRRQRSIRPRLRPHLHRGGCRRHRRGRAPGGGHPPQRSPRQAGLRHRDVQPSGPVLPTAQRRSDRCRAGCHRLGVCGVTPVPPAADEPDRGGGPGGLDDRRADGVREAVGAAVVQPAGAAGARAAGRGRAAPSRAMRWRWRRSWGTSTWRTWIRRTTSTGISPTTTCGRRWWPGMRPRPTAWPASGWTPATHPHDPRSIRSGRCRPRWPRWSNPWTATCWSCPTTTSRGSSWTSSRRCARSAAPGTGRGTAGGGDPRLRLDSIRRGPDRHLQPIRAQGRSGQPPVEPGVAGHRRRGGDSCGGSSRRWVRWRRVRRRRARRGGLLASGLRSPHPWWIGYNRRREQARSRRPPRWPP